MRVFLSHSGERSLEMARLLKRWLPNVIQSIKPWISEEIPKGSRWRTRLDEALEDTKVGIICLTATNLTSPWILFESGAISKTKDARVCTLLLDNDPTDIVGPLSDFEHTKFEKEQIRKLIHDLNSILPEPVPLHVLEKTFDHFFNELDKEISIIKITNEAAGERVVKRPLEDIMTEILERVRRLENEYRNEASPIFPFKFTNYLKPDFNFFLHNMSTLTAEEIGKNLELLKNLSYYSEELGLDEGDVKTIQKLITRIEYYPRYNKR